MPTSAEQTRERDQNDDPMQGRKPWIRVDNAQIAEHPLQRGEYQVSISGHNLKMAISPPRISVGGVALEQLRFGPDGKSITGMLPKKPESDEVIVDYGFASDNTNISWQEEPKS